MAVSEAIELLLARMNVPKHVANGGFVVLGGTVGNILMLQREMNTAIQLWHNERDVSGLRQIALTLHAYGCLTDNDLDQIMKTVDGE
jgi:hypothetical protein